MDKVVAFLEKYAQFVAIGVAVLFLGWVSYSSVLNDSRLSIKVGSEEKPPGEVDQAIAQRDAVALAAAVKTEVSPEIKKLFQTPSFDSQFASAMGPNRPNVAVATPQILPGLPREEIKGPDIQQPGGTIAELPKPPAPEAVGAGGGQSFVAQPVALQPFNLNDPNAGNQPPPQPIQVQPGQQVQGLDLTWQTVEWKIDLKKLAQAWAASFNQDGKLPGKPKVNDAPQKTVILWVEVEREELVGPNQWGHKVVLKPLPLTQVSQVEFNGGKFKTPDDAEAYRVWAEKNQLNIVEPPFYQVLSGDPWGTKSIPIPTDTVGADVQPAVDTQPFDPANPPNRELTSAEKQQVYLYKQQQLKEKQKQEAAERKSKAAAAESARKSKSTGTTPTPSRGGRGGMGPGYAPIPLAADSEFGRPAAPGARPGASPVRPGAAAPGGAATPARPVAPGDRGPVRPIPGANRPIPGPDGRPIPPAANPNPNPGVVSGNNPAAPFTPNPVLSGPFDPIEVVTGVAAGGAAAGVVVPPVIPGQAPQTDVAVWAHDPEAQPGKVYRYHMRYYLRNPLFDTNGFTKNKADAEKFALPSEWSPWVQSTAPQNVQFFFAGKKSRQQGTVDYVTVHVFKRDKGVWTKQEFNVVPGDAIGQMLNGVDFSTGSTIVDLRVPTRTDDVRILIADENGNVETRSLLADQQEDYYKQLLQKVNAPAAPGGPGQPPVGGPAAAVGRE